jgi:hypothetical protein
MSNRIDKLFKHNVQQHHVPNAGPDWAGLEHLMSVKKKKPFFVFGIAGSIFILGLLAGYLFLNRGDKTSITSGQTIVNTKIENQNSTNKAENLNRNTETINESESQKKISSKNDKKKV